jgi:ribose transport system permease protein
MKLFVLNGFLAALAGVLATARIGAGKPDLGAGSFIDVVTASIIGGTSLFGGYGNMIGTAAGVLFMSTLNVALSLLGIQPQYIMMAKGVILMVIALIDAFRRMR